MFTVCATLVLWVTAVTQIAKNRKRKEKDDLDFYKSFYLSSVAINKISLGMLNTFLLAHF